MTDIFSIFTTKTEMHIRDYRRVIFLATLFCGCLLLFSGCSKDRILPETEQEEESIFNISETEQQVVDLVNIERAKEGRQPLKIDESLLVSCDIRAQELVVKFEHARPDGSSWSTAITTAYSTAGENIAYGYASADAVMNGWMNSTGHRNNILKENYTHIGVGHYKQNGTSYWVQLFIRPQR